jgi:Protein kinase domain
MSRVGFLATLTQGAGQVTTGDARYRFGSGDVLARRYRIVSPLGRGGMGEVYRADDLTLGQAVALKFLPEQVATNAVTLERFRKEVVSARQVAHPHVCRVFDIGEADGQVFLSMEFIPGDDLDRLLKRAGRLSSELAIDLARQVAAGLQAVHDEELIHRDLKPANVMVDGRGRARLTDFGLAATTESVTGLEAYSGTPAYQAPEQLAGGVITERTDLYALGLLTYELLTGHRPFAMTDRKGLFEARKTPPVPPSTFDPTIPPEVDRIVLKCLNPDPKDRPASAHEVWRTLPGDAALNAALAAGQTPTAAVVADAGGEGRLARRTAMLLAGATLLCTAVVGLLHKQTTILGRSSHLSAAELQVKAAEIVAEFESNPGPFTSGSYWFDADFGQWQDRNDRGMNRLDGLAAGRPIDTYFFYRTSHVPLNPKPNDTGPEFVRPDDPPFGPPGSVLLRTDLTGRLLSLHRIPRGERPALPVRAPNWDRCFALAGLDPAAFQPAEPTRIWTVPYDKRHAWAGVYPERPDIPLTIEAATDHGEVVGFRLIGPWTAPETSQDEVARFKQSSPYLIIFYIVLPTLIVAVGGVLTVLHIRAGRADLRGAGLLALIDGGIFLFDLCTWAVTDPPPSASDWVKQTLMKVLLWGGLLAVAYLAFEPFVRRRWPWQLVGWTRLLAGRWRDPLVGRDVLTGALLGAVFVAVHRCTLAIPAWLGLPPELPIPMEDWGHPTGVVTSSLLRGLFIGLTLTFITFLASRVLRTRWLWVPLLVGLFMLMSHTPRLHQWLYSVPMFGCCVAGAWLMLRRGLLTVTAGYAIAFLHLAGLITLDFNTHYWPTSAVSLAAIVLIVLYGLIVSVGGWRKLGGQDRTG